MAWTREVLGDCTLYLGDCREVLPTLEDNSIDAICTDPPYALVGNARNGSSQPGDLATPYGRSGPSKKRGFMGKEWDGELPGIDVWQQALRVLKPGGHLVAFGGTRTHHRLMCALEDAGFEIRDTLMWVYGSGFPKSLDVSKAIDKAAGAERAVIDYDATKARPHKMNYAKRADRQPTSGALAGWQDNGATLTAPTTDAAHQWGGYGTALKPAWEPIILARKPLEGTVVENVLKWGCGVLNIDSCRIGTKTHTNASRPKASRNGFIDGFIRGTGSARYTHGRWPANVVHDGSEEVLALFPETSSGTGNKHRHITTASMFLSPTPQRFNGPSVGGDTGSAARFFYTAKASPSERGPGNTHPTVKPVKLCEWLCTLICSNDGTILDPFMGSGSIGIASINKGFRYIGIEREEEYFTIAKDRIAQAEKAMNEQTELFHPHDRLNQPSYDRRGKVLEDCQGRLPFPDSEIA